MAILLLGFRQRGSGPPNCKLKETAVTDKHWIQTFSGQFFFDERDGESQISIIDIARSLSRIPRFGGHTTQRLSVAEHSVVVQEIIEAEGGSTLQQLHGLLHDAHEVYWGGDLTTPFKAHLFDRYGLDLSGGGHAVQRRVLAALGLPFPEPADLPLIEKADLWALGTERRVFMPSDLRWNSDGITIPTYIEGMYGNWDEDEAFRLFEKRYEKLCSQLDFERRNPQE